MIPWHRDLACLVVGAIFVVAAAAPVRGDIIGRASVIDGDSAPRPARKGGQQCRRPPLSSFAAQEMRVGPSGSDCRIRVQTTAGCSGTMAGVVSARGKGGTNPSGECREDERK